MFEKIVLSLCFLFSCQMAVAEYDYNQGERRSNWAKYYEDERNKPHPNEQCGKRKLPEGTDGKEILIEFKQSKESDKSIIGMPFTLEADGKLVDKGITDKHGYCLLASPKIKKYEIIFATGHRFEFITEIETK
ncbi:hypothetical protein HYE54_01125 [Aggregatibacter actinomycetemcomitans]|uniref:hypothetical protein n=1 Tax=Aggregatibacter actinomycetemcomitans TaxID=714 RepID=UPI0011D41B48|nr:hypothetical protein [Aggregatibacter actinomycetemcomitans]MBN6067420.1 hypothetical protein [Aggregatibacter actinomycetemcomitans]MBN6086262.1 hypothetical protein [Aggregatibacter actinomycetemcomitans]QEH49919.1 hypothetical protein FXN57_10110 [Aggregatibacter actinomycetemcomitans]TYA48699.1 hypothetical protein FXB74_08680 [Aggregatibacter actinomycetemcomitans]